MTGPLAGMELVTSPGGNPSAVIAVGDGDTAADFSFQ